MRHTGTHQDSAPVLLADIKNVGGHPVDLIHNLGRWLVGWNDIGQIHETMEHVNNGCKLKVFSRTLPYAAGRSDIPSFGPLNLIVVLYRQKMQAILDFTGWFSGEMNVPSYCCTETTTSHTPKKNYQSCDPDLVFVIRVKRKRDRNFFF